MLRPQRDVSVRHRTHNFFTIPQFINLSRAAGWSERVISRVQRRGAAAPNAAAPLAGGASVQWTIKPTNADT